MTPAEEAEFDAQLGAHLAARAVDAAPPATPLPDAPPLPPAGHGARRTRRAALLRMAGERAMLRAEAAGAEPGGAAAEAAGMAAARALLQDAVKLAPTPRAWVSLAEASDFGAAGGVDTDAALAVLDAALRHGAGGAGVHVRWVGFWCFVYRALRGLRGHGRLTPLFAAAVAPRRPGEAQVEPRGRAAERAGRH